MKPQLITILAITILGASMPAAGAAAMTDVPRAGAGDRPEDARGQALADFTAGVFLLERGSAETAIPRLESAWEKSGRDPAIGAKLAEACFNAGDLSRCESIVDEILAANDTHAPSLLLKAKASYLRSRKDEAVSYLERLEAVGRPSFELQRILAAVYQELGLNEKALAAYRRALDIDPGHALMQYRYGLLLRDGGRVEEAEQAFRNALAANPGFADAGLQLAAILTERGLPNEAAAVLAEVHDADPSNYEVVDAMAEALMEGGQLDQAAQLLESQRRRGTLPDEGKLLLGRLYYEVDDYEESLAVFEEIYAAVAPSADLARILGEVSCKAGKTRQAEEYYRQAVRLGPGDFRNHLALFIGASATFTPEVSQRLDLPPEESLAALEAAARVAPSDDVEALYLIGIAYQSVDSLESARQLLSRAAELQPEDERVVLNLASVLEKMERYEEAERWLALLHARQPDDPTTCNFYGYLLALMGKDLDTAENLVRVALAAEPENGYYLDSLGWVLFRRGEYGRAVEELEKAARFVHDDPVILEHLGDAYTAAKRFDEALAVYERSRSLQKNGGTQELARKIDEARRRAGD